MGTEGGGLVKSLGCWGLMDSGIMVLGFRGFGFRVWGITGFRTFDCLRLVLDYCMWCNNYGQENGNHYLSP